MARKFKYVLKSKRKRIISLILSITMVLSIVPAFTPSVFAAETPLKLTGGTVRTKELNLTSTYYQNEPGIVNNGTVWIKDDEGWSYDTSTKTLTLSGVNIQNGLRGADLTIVLEEGTTNIVRSGDITGGDSQGIRATSVTIRGNGSLNVSAGTAEGGASAGISTASQDGLTIESGTVTTSGEKATNSYGYYGAKINVKGGLLIARSGQATTTSRANGGWANTLNNTACLTGAADANFAVYGAKNTYYVIDSKDTGTRVSGGALAGHTKITADTGLALTPTTADKTVGTTNSGYTWEQSTKTLTLNNVIINVDTAGLNSVSYGIYYPEGATLKFNGANIVRGGDTTGTDSIGICPTGFKENIFEGTGTLTTIGGTADSNSYGIYAVMCNPTINGGTITAIGGTTSSGSYGINTMNTIDITNATVTATGGTADIESIGIRADTTIIDISNEAIVTATGGTANTQSYGISANSTNISGGTGTAISSNAETSQSFKNEATFSNNIGFTNGAYNSKVATWGFIKTTPNITTSPTANPIYYGQTLANSTLTGGEASVDGASITGTFAWTDNSIKPKAVGTTQYDVTFTPKELTKYNIVTFKVDVKVNKATPKITTPPTASDITYGQTLEKSTLTGGEASVDGVSIAGTFAWTASTTKPTAVGTAQYDVTFIPTDTTNYNTETSKVSVTVNQTTPTITTPPTASDITFGQTLEKSTLTGGEASVDGVSIAGTFAWTASTTKPTAVGTAQYNVTFTPTDKTNYNTATCQVSVTVNKAGNNITISSLDKTYDGKSVNPTITSSSTGAQTIEYKLKGADDSTYNTTAPKNTGKYIVRVTVEADGNYKEASATKEFEISKKEITITSGITASNKVYDRQTTATLTAPTITTAMGLVAGDALTATVTGKFIDKNVANDKTINITELTLGGTSASNYKLSVTGNQTTTTANITPAKIEIGARVSDKAYDGLNIAKIYYKSTNGIFTGDDVTIIEGTATFDSVNVGKDIPISITDFTMVGKDIGNYIIIQPTGVTASITNGFTPAKDTHYTVNSNDWLNDKFVITAKDGYQLSTTNTADGTWSDTLEYLDETESSTATFYVKNTTTGEISTVANETYKIDKTKPDGDIRFNTDSVKEFLNKITFGLFYKDTINVEITTTTDSSGIKTVEYFKSKDVFNNETDLEASASWTNGSKFSITPTDKAKFIIYVKLTDNAGNISYFASNGATFDTIVPVINLETGTYYTTQKITVIEDNLYIFKLDDVDFISGSTIAGNIDKTYTFVATDKAGNSVSVIVAMKPIASLSTRIDGLTIDNVKSSDKATIEGVKADIEAEVITNATADEKVALDKITKKCNELLDKISATTTEIERIINSLNSFNPDTIKTSDEADIKKIIEDIGKLSSDNMTADEKAALDEITKKCNELLDKISAATTEIERITNSFNSFNPDAIKTSDEADIKKIIEDIGKLSSSNMTADEKAALDVIKEKANGFITMISNVKNIEDLISKLPQSITKDHKATVDNTESAYNKLTANEKKILDQDLLNKLKDAIKIVNTPDNSDTPNNPGIPLPPSTASNINVLLWIILLFVSGGAIITPVIVKKFKKDNSK